jgi:TDG/mug DNA glycosylase family protein
VTTGRRGDLLASYGRVIPDLVTDGLRVLLVGITPSLWSGGRAYHLRQPEQPVVAGAQRGRLDAATSFGPTRPRTLLASGIGTPTSCHGRRRAPTSSTERRSPPARTGWRAGKRLPPGWVAVLGLTAWRLATGDRTAAVGPAGRAARRAAGLLLPNPSGLNAGWPLPRLIEAYAALRGAAY